LPLVVPLQPPLEAAMAYLRRDVRTGHWCVGFRYHGQEFHRSCRTNRKPIALRIQATVEETIDMLESGRLIMPETVDPAFWILSGGKANGKKKERKQRIQFGPLCDAYTIDQRQKAESTRYAEGIHISHLKRLLGVKTQICRIDLQKLKRYSEKRSFEKYRGKAISSATIRKELTTFRQIWVWAQRHGHVDTGCPLLGPGRGWELKLPKPVEHTKFQTWAQIERRINRGGLTPAEIRDLWAGLYLDEDQIGELLAFVKKQAPYPFIYPMYAFAAYTGARRSEVLRSRVDDIEFDMDQVMIRERKRRQHLAESCRFVPLHPRLRSILREWFELHPDGQYTIVCSAQMPRRKPTDGPRRLTMSQATHHFKHTLRSSKWNVIGGFHVLRHSFGSNLVRSGKVPSDVVARWMGHTTEEMKQLYQHLFPQDGLAQISVLR
jgi:integrase